MIRSFSLTARMVFFVLSIIFAISGLLLLGNVSRVFMTEVPAYGGKYTEGIVGVPRFINPILSITNAGDNLTTLIYSGLMKETADGKIVTDLAESYTISEDGKVYTFTIKEDAKFHDGKPVTTEDVEATIRYAVDPIIKSPKRPLWQGIVVERKDARTISFTLKQPYSLFIEQTTLGILPKHIWKNVSSEEFAFSSYNIHPIGSGPYKVKDIGTNSGGIPTYYELESFDKYVGGEAYIEKITFRFYQNEEQLMAGYENGEVETISSISPEQANILKNKGVKILRSTLPRMFGVFFNQNEAPIFLNKEVREALNLATDKERIINETLSGFGKAIASPVPLQHASIFTTPYNMEESIAKAESLLEKNGWKKNVAGIRERKKGNKTETLSFSISTSDSVDLKKTASLIKEMWEKIGASVDIHVYETGDLNQTIIRPRKYEALLFGEIVNKDPDLFAFWHSSQRIDPGLNVAIYTNSKADHALEEARIAEADEVRAEKYSIFEQEVVKDIPAVFLYSPDFLYVMPERIKGFVPENIQDPKERFLDSNKRYIETNYVWNAFIKNN